MDNPKDLIYMGLALDLARRAADEGEVPVGAVIVDQDGKVIGTGSNRREADQDPIAHAEIMAISQAAHHTGFWRLEETTLYVTLEPCPMCSGAIINSRIPRVVYGAADKKAGAVNSLFNLLTDSRLNHRCEVTSGIKADESAQLLSDFFKQLRKQGKK
ncbi:MAG: tRNA adenosine(34) deaminase TadA [Deltaproteobacteria bacterium]|nr:tRNA adenosine(34) deaminase TadA [Deltaproteobacteria bacterium]